MALYAFDGTWNENEEMEVELAVNCMIEHMSQSLSAGKRIGARGYGSLSLHY